MAALGGQPRPSASARSRRSQATPHARTAGNLTRPSRGSSPTPSFRLLLSPASC